MKSNDVFKFRKVHLEDVYSRLDRRFCNPVDCIAPCVRCMFAIS